MNTVIYRRKQEAKMPSNFSSRIDQFYSRSNIEYLKKVTSEIDSGIAKLEEHELFEIASCQGHYSDN